MRSFFVQLLLSFWISTLGTFVAATVIFPRADYAYRENTVSALEHSVLDLAQMKLLAAADNHCRVLEQSRTDILVVDEHEADICGASVPADAARLASDARNRGVHQFGKVGNHWAIAELVSSPSDRKSFIAVYLTPFRKAPWFPNLPAAALPVSALVTFVFAYLLTNPVRALRRAFRRFAAGDLSVRLPVVRSAFRDWGGADIRTLMMDFNEMADRIQALLSAHKTLLRDVSHELRSPLARLNVALELARDEARPDGAAALDRAELESSRLNALIGELLSLSHMEALQTSAGRQNVNLGSLIEELMPDLLYEAEARGCRLVHRSGTALATVPGSEKVLRRAFENVIRNAIRYSPQDSVVEIQTGTEQSADSHASFVRVCDRGPGVPEQDLDAIFRPFFRVDVSRQQATGGFGVGLAIADRAVHVHGGSIRAHNRPEGGGLCVEMTFPSTAPSSNS